MSAGVMNVGEITRSYETTPNKGQSRETGKIATFALPIVHVCSIHLPHF